MKFLASHLVYHDKKGLFIVVVNQQVDLQVEEKSPCLFYLTTPVGSLYTSNRAARRVIVESFQFIAKKEFKLPETPTNPTARTALQGVQRAKGGKIVLNY